MPERAVLAYALSVREDPFVGTEGLLAIPLGYAAGVIAKDVLLAMFLVPRVRGIGSPGAPLVTAPGAGGSVSAP